MPRFSLHRFWAVVLKEFIQMMRDRVTFGIMVGIPLMQLLLFGFAINSDPKHLPTLGNALRLTCHSANAAARLRFGCRARQSQRLPPSRFFGF